MDEMDKRTGVKLAAFMFVTGRLAVLVIAGTILLNLAGAL